MKSAILIASCALALFAFGTSSASALTPTDGPHGAAFYVPPNPLPAGNHGDLIRYEISTANLYNSTRVWSFRIMYLSESATGKPTAVTGTVLVPKEAWTGGGERPIVAFAAGTQGMGDDCAMSLQIPRGTEYEAASINTFINRGYAVFATDYEGLGVPGDHPYVVGAALGKNVLDMVRATRYMPKSEVKPTTPIVIAGYSEGGNAAVWAGQLRKTYAPEIVVKGVLAGGVPADLKATAAFNNGGVGAGVLLYASIGLSSVYPNLNYYNTLTSTGKAAYNKANASCLLGNTFANAFKNIANYTLGGQSLNEIFARPGWSEAFAATKAGQTGIDAPLFLYQGTLDEVIPRATSRTLKADYCAKGTKTLYKEYVGDHVTTMMVGWTEGASWVTSRFKNQAAPTSC